MSQEVYALCESVLLEIETIQNHLDVVLRFALDLDDQIVSDEFAAMQANLNNTREQLIARMRAESPSGIAQAAPPPKENT